MPRRGPAPCSKDARSRGSIESQAFLRLAAYQERHVKRVPTTADHM